MLKKIISSTNDYNKFPKDILKKVRAMNASKTGDKIYNLPIYTELNPVKIENLGTTKNKIINIGPGYHTFSKNNPPYGNILKLTTKDGSIFYFLQESGGNIDIGEWSLFTEGVDFFETDEGNIVLSKKDKKL